jgi:hypothetical protein
MIGWAATLNMVAMWDSGWLVNIIMRFARNGQLVSR